MEQSKLEQAAKAYQERQMSHFLLDNDKTAFKAGAKSEAAKEYWQSLTTPASNAVDGQMKHFAEWIGKGFELKADGDYWSCFSEEYCHKYNFMLDELYPTKALVETFLFQELSTPSNPHTVDDPFIEKHLAIIKEKTIENLIRIHIEGMGELEKASVKYFLETGKVNGSFLQRLKDLILSTPKYITPKPTVEEGQTQEPVKTEENDFWVECAVCKTQLKNWTGSTPCCGSIAYIVENGETTGKINLFASIGDGPIKPTTIDLTPPASPVGIDARQRGWTIQSNTSKSPSGEGDAVDDKRLRFAEWTASHGWSYDCSAEVWDRSPMIQPSGPFTTAELYQLYLQSNK